MNIYKYTNFLQIIYKNTVKLIFFPNYLQKYDFQLLQPHLQYQFATVANEV